MMTIADHTAW